MEKQRQASKVDLNIQNVFAQVSFISYPVPIKDFLDKQDCKIFGDKSNLGR